MFSSNSHCFFSNTVLIIITDFNDSSLIISNQGISSCSVSQLTSYLLGLVIQWLYWVFQNSVCIWFDAIGVSTICNLIRPKYHAKYPKLFGSQFTCHKLFSTNGRWYQKRFSLLSIARTIQVPSAVPAYACMLVHMLKFQPSTIFFDQWQQQCLKVRLVCFPVICWKACRWSYQGK